MIVLVTGGCGFIGSAVANRLVSEGDTVDIVDDLSPTIIDVVYDVDILRKKRIKRFESTEVDVCITEEKTTPSY